MLTGYARNDWLSIIAIGVLLAATFLYIGFWPGALIVAALDIALLSFFRDPHRRPPMQRDIVVSPADGRVTAVTQLDYYEPLGGPAVCIRVFLSVLNVHVNRSPCHAKVASITHRPGLHRNALNDDAADANESVLTVLDHPTHGHPIAAVRQIAGMLARTVVCAAREDEILQRGQRMGMIKLGSTTELYLPQAIGPSVVVQPGQHVKGGLTVIAKIAAPMGVATASPTDTTPP